MRLIQELMDLLVRARSLQRRGEYEAALQEIDLVLKKLQEGAVEMKDGYSLPHLLDLCVQEGEAPHEQMVVLADLFLERALLLGKSKRPDEAQGSFALALGLNLEVLHLGYVSTETITKVEQLIDITQGGHLGNPVFHRLVRYLEERSMLGRAEDAYFSWLEQGEPIAGPLGLAFYERLDALPDEQLLLGGLPRDEVRDGRQAFNALLEGVKD